MAESKQTFEGGLSMDLSQAFNKKGTYIDALNVDIILDEINGSVALTNSKGNKLQVTIPKTSKIYNISPLVYTGGDSVSQMVIGGKNIAFGSGKTGKQLYDAINSAVPNLISNKSIELFYDETRVVIIENVYSYISITNPGRTLVRNTSLEVPATASSDHHPIGYGVIGEDIYIITTSSTSSTTGGPGFFWKFNYNKETFDGATIELLYGAQLNMSTYYNIPPTGVVTRYETDAIKKMWFTDFYNPLRSIWLNNPNLMTEDPTTLSSVPGNLLYKPILTGVADGGSIDLAGGVYQACYRLTKELGTSSAYSQLSALVPIGDTPLSSAYQDYIGGVTGTPAIITWEVNNIDTNYDYIELIVFIRKTDDYGVSYDIFSVETKKIDNQESISFDIDQAKIDEKGTPTTLSEVVIGGYTGFTHCKTIAEKDNLLIAANLKNTASNEGLNYDCRAYRFNKYGDLKLLDKGAPIEFHHPVSDEDLRSIPLDSDAINFNPEEYKFKRDGITLGGEGINISFEFVTEDFLLDNQIDSIAASPYAPFFTTIKASDTIDLGVKSPVDTQTYSSTFYSGYKNPQTAGLLKGYMRNETYRFANNFYAKDNTPLFAEWICDIKFPDYIDKHTAKQGDFRITSNYYNDTLYSNKLYAHALGVKFTYKNIPSSIGGYSAVRVERKKIDKTVLFQGFTTNTVEFRGPTGSPGSEYYSDDDATNLSNPDKVFFRSSLMGLGDNIISSSFKLRYCYGLQLSSIGTYYKYNINFNTSKTAKAYRFIGPSKKLSGLPISSLKILTPNDTYTLSFGGSSATVRPRSHPQEFRYSDSGEVTSNNKWRFKDYGTSNSYFLHTPDISPSDMVSIAPYSQYLVANIENVNPNQYGGNSNTSRSQNIYISTGHYRLISDSAQVTGSETFKVFGGDTFICINDVAIKNKNWDLGTTEGERLQYNACIPLESTENVDMVGPARLNNTFTDNFDNSNNSWLVTADVRYLTTYSAEDTIKQFFPKPSSFFEVNKWVNRFAASEVKLNGELEESWSKFLSSDYWDTEGQYGEINSILSRDSKLYFWQDKAFGIMQVNPRAYVGDLSNATTDVQVQLGFGGKLQRHDYISTISGSKHQGSTLNTVVGLFWFDINSKKIFKFTTTKDGISATSISDAKGLYAYLSKNIVNKIVNGKTLDKPCYINGNERFGITTGYDTRTGKVYFTFHNGLTSTTLCYNERTDTFVSFYSTTPNMYISDSNNLFTFNNQSLYVNEKGAYNNYYGALKPSKVKFVVNDAPDTTKVFSNINMTTQSIKDNKNISKDTWSTLRVSNDYQDTGVVDLVYKDGLYSAGNMSRVERIWKIAIPRNRMTYDIDRNPDVLSQTRLLFGDRIRDNYINVELEYNNPNNNLLKTSVITTSFKESPR